MYRERERGNTESLSCECGFRVPFSSFDVHERRGPLLGGGMDASVV